MPSAPISTTDFMILVALANQPLHGYAIAQTVNAESGGRFSVGLGSLYRVIARMETAGLIKESRPQPAEPNRGKRRRIYEITAAGRRAVAAEAHRMKAALALARSNKLLADE